MVDAATLEKLEAGFQKLQAATDCKSLLRKYLTKEVYDSLKNKKTSFGSTLLDVIQSGEKRLRGAGPHWDGCHDAWVWSARPVGSQFSRQSEVARYFWEGSTSRCFSASTNGLFCLKRRRLHNAVVGLCCGGFDTLCIFLSGVSRWSLVK